MRSDILDVVQRRWPGWVYDKGAEPDPRFSFANERTFLAWVRTALALLAAGVALHAVPLDLPSRLRSILAAVFLLLAIVCAIAGWLRWARAERAMRIDAPLPAFGVAALLALATALVGVVLLAAITTR